LFDFLFIIFFIFLIFFYLVTEAPIEVKPKKYESRKADEPSQEEAEKRVLDNMFTNVRNEAGDGSLPQDNVEGVDESEWVIFLFFSFSFLFFEFFSDSFFNFRIKITKIENTQFKFVCLFFSNLSSKSENTPQNQKKAKNKRKLSKKQSRTF